MKRIVNSIEKMAIFKIALLIIAVVFSAFAYYELEFKRWSTFRIDGMPMYPVYNLQNWPPWPPHKLTLLFIACIWLSLALFFPLVLVINKVIKRLSKSRSA